MTPEIVTIKLEPLTDEAIRPYGRMLQSKQTLFPEVEPGEGRVAIELLKIKPGRETGAIQIRHMAIHFSYNQTFVPLKGSMILVLAPAPSRDGVAEAEYTLDFSRVKAFLLEAGQGAFIDKGVWHSGAVLPGIECEWLNVTRKNPGEKSSDQFASPAQRGYVEFVDIAKRDNKLIQIAAVK